MPTIKLGSQSSSEHPSDEDLKTSERKLRQKKDRPKSRILDNWLTAYGQYTTESESPDDYHLWTGLSILASAIRRNVWLNQGIYLLFPNLYTILVGPPGVAKSTTIRMGRKILLGVEDIIIGPDSLTREELIKVMANSGKKQSQSAVTLHSSELSSLIEPSGVKMIQFLTDIFDAASEWKYSTKGSGRDVVNNPILNVLAGTTPMWIADGLPSTVIGHGFTSRIVFVWGEKPRYLKPFPEEPDPTLVRALKNDLDYISRIEGEFQWGEGSKDEYSRIYEELATTSPRDFRIEGFHARKKIHVLKVAMLLSLAEGDSLVISVRDLKTAEKILNQVEVNMAKTFSAVGKYEHASDLERIEKRIINEGGLTPQQIHDEFYAVGDVQEIAKILLMLVSMGRIKKTKNKNGDVIYASTAV